MSVNCNSCAATAKPASAGWWLRVFVALLFVFQISFIHFHLFSEVHHDDLHGVACHTETVGDLETDHGGHHNSGHHQPHFASDHQLQMRPQSAVSLLVVDFIVSEISLSLTQPEAFVARIVAEDELAPGAIPPDPLQPRAPPAV